MDAFSMLLSLVIIVISIALHEFGHAAMADKLGDPTPRSQGRLTLNPVAHFDPMGFLMICFTIYAGFGLGWGRPVIVNPMYFKEYRKGLILVAIAGPAMNLCLACFSLAITYIFYISGMPLTAGSHTFLLLMLMINFFLIVFNMLPVPPLDGGNVLEQLLPFHLRRPFEKFKQYSFLLLIFIIISGVTSTIFGFFISIALNVLAFALGGGFVDFLLRGQA